MSGAIVGSEEGGGGGERGPFAFVPGARPDPASPTVEETAGKLNCTLLYHYEAKKGDQISWSFEKDDDGNEYISFAVRRKDSDAVKFLHDSKPLIPDHGLEKKAEQLDVKKGFYKLELKKGKDFRLTDFFLPDTP